LGVVVFTRSTPDTAAKVEAAGAGVTWGDAATIVNPWDEYALEESLVQAEKLGGKSTVIAIGEEFHNEALRHSLAMGFDEAIRIDDPALAANQSFSYAAAAAAAVKRIGDVQLIIAGREAVDTGTDQHIIQLARRLGWSYLSNVSKIIGVDASAGTLQVERQLEQGRQTVTTRLPAVITVTKEINEPRYPSFIGIRKASKATIPVWSLTDLGLTPVADPVVIEGFRNLPPRNVTLERIEGTPEEMAKKLVDRLIEEKVL